MRIKPADAQQRPKASWRVTMPVVVWGAFALALPLSSVEPLRPELLGMNLHPSYYVMLAGVPLLAIASGLTRIHLAIRFFICAGIFTLAGAFAAIANGTAPSAEDVVKWTTFFGTAAIVAVTIRGEDDVRRIIVLATVGIAALCAYGLYLYYTQSLLWVNPFEGTASRNALSNWTAGLFVFAFYFALRSRPIPKAFWLVALGTMVLAQVYTANRSSWWVIGLSMLGVVVAVRDTRTRLQGVVIAVLCSLAIGTGMFVDTADLLGRRAVTMSQENLGAAAEARLTHLAKTAGIFADHPLLGVGIGQYRFAEPESDFSHNVYFTIIGETGLVGSFTVGGLMLVTAATGFRALRGAGRLRQRQTKEALLVVMLAGAMCLFRGITSHEIQFMPVTGLLLGLLVAYFDMAASDPTRPLFMPNGDGIPAVLPAVARRAVGASGYRG